MTIEISSVSERRILSFRGVARSYRWAFRKCVRTARRPAFQVAIAVIVIALAAASDSFLRSYKYYSKIIDARLASGYLTSRAGLYAAPRTIRAGQGFSQDELIAVLRRADHVGSEPEREEQLRDTGTCRYDSLRSDGQAPGCEQ